MTEFNKMKKINTVLGKLLLISVNTLVVKELYDLTPTNKLEYVYY